VVFRVEWESGVLMAQLAESYVLSLRLVIRGDNSPEWRRFARDKMLLNKMELRAWQKRLNERRMKPNAPGIRLPRALFRVSD
jgi:hypothetical protein